MVYFVKCEQYVKIGYTSNMKNRYKAYVTENPFPTQILHVIKGGLKIEKEIHVKMKDYLHRGEWFHYNIVTQRMIKQIVKESVDNIEVKAPKRRRRKRTTKSKVKVYSLKGKPSKL